MKHLMFSLLLIVLVVGIANTQTVTDIMTVTATVTTGLSITGGDFGIDGLAPGNTYDVKADPALDPRIVPDFQGAASVTADNWVIGTDPGANIILTFNLPTKLYGDFGQIGIRFGEYHGFVEETGMYFDPRVPFVFNTGVGDEYNIAMGMFLDVPNGSITGDYIGVIIGRVQHTGL